MRVRLLAVVLVLLALFVPTHILADTSVTFYATADNCMCEESPAANQGSQQDLAIGYAWEGYRYRSLLEFTVDWDVDIPTDAVITSATLSLYYYSGSGNPGGLAAYIRRLLRTDWSETESSWEEYKAGSDWTTDGAGSSSSDYTLTGQTSTSVPSGGGGVWLNWNILSQIQWAKTNDTSVDVLVCAYPEVGGSVDRAVSFASREYPGTDHDPKLVISYSLPIPVVVTNAATSVTGDSALLNGSVTSGAPLTTRGFQYGLTKVATWDSHEDGTFATGIYSQTVSGLSADTLYWFRAYAINDIGTDYGTWVFFRTLGFPVCVTNDATYVGSTSARLNGRLTDDGGGDCEYRFQYGYAAGVYDFETSWLDSITTGRTFYADVTGLMSDKTYYFRAQVRNSAGVSNGDERSFTTAWELLPPTNFVSHATSGSEVSLSWIRGGGSDTTLILMKTGSYPGDTTDGTQVYFSTGSSISVTGLTAGTTYYFSAWGESSGDYSSEYAKTLTTTLAGSPVTEPTNPEEPTGWFQIPSDARITGMPFYSWVNNAFDKYELPHVTGWVLLALLFSALAGVAVLAIFPRDPMGTSAGAVFAALTASGLVMMGASWMGVLPFWLILIPATIGGSYAFVKSRT